LIESLQEENKSWNHQLLINKENKKSLTGDVLVSSGIIAYLGVFTKEYREDCVKSWVDKLKSFDITVTPNFKLENVLGNQVQIANWRV
jgi:dynein heavy chain